MVKEKDTPVVSAEIVPASEVMARTEADKNFARLVEEGAVFIKTGCRTALTWQWGLGKKVVELTSDRAAIYGNRSVEQYADALTATNRYTVITRRWLDGCKAFAVYLTEEQVNAAAEIGLPPSIVAELCTSRISSEQRTRLLGDILESEKNLQRTDVRERIAGLLGHGADAEKSKGEEVKDSDASDIDQDLKAAVKALKGAESWFTTMASRPFNFGDAIKTIMMSDSEEEMKVAKERLISIRNSIGTISSQWQEQLSMAEKVI